LLYNISFIYLNKKKEEEDLNTFIMSDFLAENNQCGQALLRLVARGNSIISELFRLSDYIPTAFIPNTTNNNKYSEIIFDFNYLSNQVMKNTKNLFLFLFKFEFTN
jgi:hypothetical protein